MAFRAPRLRRLPPASPSRPSCLSRIIHSKLHDGAHPTHLYPRAQGLEEIGRAARYKILFDAMTREGISILLVEYHLDDQIETGLMRLARGSGIIGVRGMQPMRRCGVGSIKGAGAVNEESEKWFYGLSGMSRWISQSSCAIYCPPDLCLNFPRCVPRRQRSMSRNLTISW